MHGSRNNFCQRAQPSQVKNSHCLQTKWHMYKLWSHEILSDLRQRGPEFCRIGLKTQDHSEDIFPCLRYTHLLLPHCSYKKFHSGCQLCSPLWAKSDKILVLVRHHTEFVILLDCVQSTIGFKSQSTQPGIGVQGENAMMLFWNSSVTSALYQRALLQCFSFKCYQISEPGQVNKSCYSAVNSTAKKLVRFWLPAELHDQSVHSMIPRIQIFKIKMTLFQGGGKTHPD